MDRIARRFLENTEREALRLSSDSEVLTITPLPPRPASTYLCELVVPHLRRTGSGRVDVTEGPVVARIHFPEDYLRGVDPYLPMKVVSLLGPASFFHPNVAHGAVCLGYRFAPGTRIGVLLDQLYQILSYQNCNVNEADALNPEACRLLRAHPELVEALHPRPLLPRRREVRVEVRS